jgi:hypothetical protein
MAILAGGVSVLASVSSADLAPRPVISGSPIVGEVLTSSPAGDTGLYRWQGCDPAVASCVDAPFPDGNWTDLTNPTDVRTYTVQATDLGHYIRVLAKGTSLGTQFTPSEPVGPVQAGALAPQPQEPPAPQHGIQLIGEPVTGSVKVKLPGQKGFVPINGLTTIPVNSVIDTRRSRVKLTAATGDLGDTTPDQSVDFYGGLFRIQQERRPTHWPPRSSSKLRCAKGNGSDAKASKSGGPVAATAGKRRRRVWGSGSGSYGTAGGGGTGSVRGTTWLTQDTCKGTFFKVTEGIGITVFDSDLDKQVPLGQARATSPGTAEPAVGGSPGPDPGSPPPCRGRAAVDEGQLAVANRDLLTRQISDEQAVAGALGHALEPGGGVDGVADRGVLEAAGPGCPPSPARCSAPIPIWNPSFTPRSFIHSLKLGSRSAEHLPGGRESRRYAWSGCSIGAPKTA